MPAILELKEELDDIVTMKFIAQAFTEASAAKLGKIRGAFEKNKAFYDEISHVYHLVRLGGEALLKSRAKEKKKKETVEPPKKVLSVAVTSNQRFYGTINITIMRSILDDLQKTKTDLFVIGSTGRDFMRMTSGNVPFESIQFAKEFPTLPETAAFLDKTTPYGTVYIYYPKFVTLLTQTVGKSDITQAINPKDPTPEEEIHILFEPEYEEILAFFQRSVRTLLFLRIMLESDLSRTAARLISMSSAEDRADELSKEKKSQMRKAVTSLRNRQLLETFSGMSKWKH